MSPITDPEQRHRKLVELNVVEQCLNLFKTGVVQRARKESYDKGDKPFVAPRVHGLVYNPTEGILHRLPIDFKERTHKLNGLYDLY